MTTMSNWMGGLIIKRIDKGVKLLLQCNTNGLYNVSLVIIRRIHSDGTLNVPATSQGGLLGSSPASVVTPGRRGQGVG